VNCLNKSRQLISGDKSEGAIFGRGSLGGGEGDKETDEWARAWREATR